MTTKMKRIIGWVLTGLISAFMLFSAFMKLEAGPEMAKSLEGGKVTLETMRYIGIVEVLCVVFWLIPRTGIVGMLLLCGYLGGAIYAHVSMAQPFVLPAALSALVWIASALRFPELARRLFGGQTETELEAAKAVR